VRKWLPYFEGFVLVLVVGMIFLYAKRNPPGDAPPSPSQAQALIEKADALFAKEDLAPALIAYWDAIRSIRAAGGNIDRELLLHAHLRVSEIYYHSNWTEDAEAHLKHTVEINPNYPPAHLLRGKIQRDAGESALAVKEFLAVLEFDPAHAEAHYQLGVLYQGARQYEQAITHYKKAIESDPDLTPVPFESVPIGLQARLQLSRTYRRILQDYQLIDRELTSQELAQLAQLEDQGIEILEEIAKINPNFTEAKEELIGLLYGKAAALGRSGEERFYDEALTVYEKIVQLDPKEIEAWRWIGQIYESFLQDPEEALKAYKQAYALEPDPGTLAQIKSLEEELRGPGKGGREEKGVGNRE
jgi:tetratricopeptide (TPR) repeat protein